MKNLPRASLPHPMRKPTKSSVSACAQSWTYVSRVRGTRDLQVIARVRRKAAMLGQDYTAEEPVQAACESQQTFKVDPDTVAELFQDWVMPLTKDVEVLYLLRRLEWEA